LIDGLTWDNPLHALTKSDFGGLKDPRVLAGGLFLLMVILYVVIR